MTDAPELLRAHHLKTLRRPTFLREYDKQARICAADRADHVRYLARLGELEQIDRERRMAERRIKAAKFPAVKSLSSRALLGTTLPGSGSASTSGLSPVCTR